LSGALVNGFVPQLGDSLVILTASTVSGRFDTLDLPLPPTGLDWEVLYNPDNVTLHLAAAQIPGDLAKRADALPHSNLDLVQSPGGRMGINDLPGGAPPTVMPHVADVKTQSIRIGTGRTKLLEAPWPVARVAVNDPEIADIEALTPQRFMVMGNSIGTTDLVFWNEDDEAWRMRVNVVVDVTDLVSELQDIFPYANLDLIQSQDVLIIKGELRRAEHAPYLRAILDAYGIKYVDMTTVAGTHQVLLHVRVAEVSRDAIRALGINAIHAGNDFFGALRIGPDVGGPINPVPIFPRAGAPATGNIPFVFGESGVSSGISLLAGIPGADLVLFFEALAENQYARILAEPSLVALSGEEATFLAGGEFPIPIIQGSAAGGGATVTIEYKEFGVRLNFRPFVLGDGRIRLYVAPEVSELSDFGAVIIEGFRVPSVLTRRAATTLELRSGQTFAMAGLLKQTISARKSRVPLLGDLPVIGPLFRSVRYSQGETELLVLVTASLVEPLSLANARHLPGHAHQPPSNWDLFINGKIEAPTPSALAPPDAERARQLGLDRLKGPGAWVTHEQPRVISTTGDRTQLQ
ncbi:MAG: type II and III secretion system protein family protein, partial [Acidimicrobiia bacterium]